MREEAVLRLLTPKLSDWLADHDLNLKRLTFFHSRNKNQVTQWWIVIFCPWHAISLVSLRCKIDKGYLNIYLQRCVVDQVGNRKYTWDRRERISVALFTSLNKLWRNNFLSSESSKINYTISMIFCWKNNCIGKQNDILPLNKQNPRNVAMNSNYFLSLLNILRICRKY